MREVRFRFLKKVDMTFYFCKQFTRKVHLVGQNKGEDVLLPLGPVNSGVDA